jgi:hypothetical protein
MPPDSQNIFLGSRCDISGDPLAVEEGALQLLDNTTVLRLTKQYSKTIP